MKKCFYIVTVLFFIPIIVNAETLTYNVCQNDCPYNSLDTVLTELKQINNSTGFTGQDIIINILDSGTYQSTQRYNLNYYNIIYDEPSISSGMIAANPENINSFTINGNNSVNIISDLNISANELNFNNFSSNGEHEIDVSLSKNINISNLDTVDISGQIDANRNIIVNDSTNLGIRRIDGSMIINNSSLNGLIVTETGSFVEVNNSIVELLMTIGGVENQDPSYITFNNSKIACEGNDYCMVSFFDSIILNNSTIGGTPTISTKNLELRNSNILNGILLSAQTANIYGGKVNKVLNMSYSDINIYNSELIGDSYRKITDINDLTSIFENGDFNYIYNSDKWLYNFVDIKLEETQDVNTYIHFDKELSINKGDTINYLDVFDYLNSNESIQYTVENNSIAKVQNNIVTGLNGGETNIIATTDDGHFIYTLKLKVSSSDSGIIKKVEVQDNFGNADFNADNLEDIIPLTNQEITAKESGKDINVFLEVKDISENISAQEKATINDKITNNETLAMYLDVSLFKQIEGENPTKIEETNNNIKISINIPESIMNYNPSIIRKYYILRLHNGVVEKLETKVDGNTLSFETDKFSTYALTYTDVNNPKTGDNIYIYICTMFISLIGITINRKVKN